MKNKTKRIAIFIPSFRGGGAERAMILFANELVLQGHKVDFLVLSQSGPLVSSLDPSVNLIDLKAPRAISSVLKVIRYLRANKPELLYSTIIHINLVSIISVFLARVSTKVIVRESNMPSAAFSSSFSGRISMKLLPLLYPSSEAVIAVSQNVSEELQSLNSSLSSKIHVLPTPVITEQMYELAREVLPISKLEDENFILGIGRLHSQKDFTTLIRAFSQLDHSEDLKLVILGEGSERKSLEKLISELSLDYRVFLPGFMDNPFSFLSRAKVFVSSSSYEGMPNVLIQALAFGVPSVSTDCPGGARDIASKGSLVTLVPVGDIAALSKAIADNLLSGRSESAQIFAKDTYGVTNATRSYLSLGKLTDKSLKIKSEVL